MILEITLMNGVSISLDKNGNNLDYFNAHVRDMKNSGGFYHGNNGRETTYYPWHNVASIGVRILNNPVYGD